MKLDNKNILVTGGSSGLGMATVKMAAKSGCNVIILDVSDEKGNSLAKEVGAKSIYMRCDVSNELNVSSVIKEVVKKYQRIDGLINCAGIAIGEKTLGKEGPHKFSSFEKVINVNLIGSFNMIRLVSQEMSKNEPNDESERGVIINTASVAAFDGQIGQAAYSASKGGIVGMTLPIARDLSRSGIRVMTIAPGLFETPMLTGMPLEVQEALGKQVPFPQRLGKAEEYANLVKAIFENVMLNGEVIRLDGAIRMAPK